MSSQESSGAPNHETHNSADASAVRHRRLRRGTSSCWECKRHKIRCHFKSGDVAACESCTRRSSRCIPQTQPQAPLVPRNPCHQDIGRRIVLLESRINQLVRQTSEVSGGPREVSNKDGQRPQSEIVENQQPLLPAKRRLLPRPDRINDSESRHRSSATLPDRREFLGSVRDHPGLQSPLVREPAGENPINTLIQSFLPPASIAIQIFNRGKVFRLATQFLRKPARDFVHATSGLERVRSPHRFTGPSRPVLVARQLIQLAICLQQLDPTRDYSDLCLGGSIRDISRHYFDAASRYVTSQESLVLSPEGLETLFYEGIYHTSVGDLRRAWLVFRRAMGIAYLMGLQNPKRSVSAASHADAATEFLFFRLSYMERYLSLILSLPCSSVDDTVAAENALAAVEPVERLERIHALVMGRIITRNQLMQRHDGSYDHHGETRDIDYQLKQAAKGLPTKWWSPTSLRAAPTDAEKGNEISRFIMHLHQYQILLLLHIPYILPRRVSNSAMQNSALPDYSYSRLSAITAARESLTRVMLHRTAPSMPSSSQSVTLKVYTSALALILAHIDGYRLGRDNFLEHQRPHDLEMVDDAVKTLEVAIEEIDDALRKSNVLVLRKLRDIEADAASGTTYNVWSEPEATSDQINGYTEEDEHTVKFSLPYFGTVWIVRQEPAAVSTGDTCFATGMANADIVTSDRGGEPGGLLPDETSTLERSLDWSGLASASAAEGIPSAILDDEPGANFDWTINGGFPAMFDLQGQSVENMLTTVQSAAQTPLQIPEDWILGAFGTGPST